MDAPTILVSTNENLGDPIDIKVDIIHPEPIAAVVFPAVAVVRIQAHHREAIRGILEHLQEVPIEEEMSTLRFRMGGTLMSRQLVMMPLRELAYGCAVRMFPEESYKIERYVSGLPDMIHGSLVASKPKTMREAIEMATELMDKKIHTFAERQVENKRKLKNNNQTQQQPIKKQVVAITYTGFVSGEREG
ncbi:hypothetical protein Tco_0574991 [Tanacetum coccineum]